VLNQLDPFDFGDLFSENQLKMSNREVYEKEGTLVEEIINEYGLYTGEWTCCDENRLI